MEELVEWIKRDLPDDGTASMGGPMPVMANLLLSTGRPVVNHPHYEDAGIGFAEDYSKFVGKLT